MNILVYAHRNDERWHRPYRSWLEHAINSGQPFALSVLVAVGFLRLVTNPRIFSPPTPLGLAISAMNQLAARPTCRIIAPGPDHWLDVAALCRATGATGKLVADAQHAAFAISEGCTWVTRDSDFARFVSHGLVWEHLCLDRA